MAPAAFYHSFFGTPCSLDSMMWICMVLGNLVSNATTRWQLECKIVMTKIRIRFRRPKCMIWGRFWVIWGDLGIKSWVIWGDFRITVCQIGWTQVPKMSRSDSFNSNRVHSNSNRENQITSKNRPTLTKLILEIILNQMLKLLWPKTSNKQFLFFLIDLRR